MQNKITLVIAILLIFTIHTGYGQAKKTTSKVQDKALAKEQLKEYFEDAEFFYDQEDYREALFNFLKINEKNPDNANINYRIGMCYVNIPGEESKAIPYFEKAIPKISTKYEKSSVEETKAPLYMLYYLGNAYRIDNQITKALDTYNKFRNHPYFEGHFNEGMVDTEIAACERAKIIQDNPVKINVTNLGAPVNNANSNRCPVINKDETVIVYLSSLKFYDAIFMSKKENNVWGEPDNISAQVGSDGDCEPVCISSDGKELYFMKKVKGNNELYVSILKDGLWTMMTPLNKNINSSKNENHASISADGLTLYFSSERRGGKGKLDIYKSERKAGSDWGPAQNLGDAINTEFDETTPFICEDGKTLYFSSEGHLSMGGFDIFTSTLQTSGKWEKPANAGYPINTTGSNLFYNPIKNGEIAYTTKIEKDGLGKEDIYRIENLSIKSRIAQSSNGKSSSKKVVVRDKQTNEILGIMYLDQNSDSVKIQQSSDKIDIKVGE